MVTISHVLCPVDFSDCSRHAFTHAVAIAQWYRARVSVLHVHRLTTPVLAAPIGVAPVGLQPIVLTADERAHLRDALDAFVGPGRGPDTSIDISVEEDLDVAGAIVAHAESTRADLLVLGTHGRSGFERFMVGSVTEKVLRRTPIPVLTVPPRADAPGRPLSMRPHIICAVDFSTSSTRALDYAASLAREGDGVLTLLHVVDVPPESTDPSLPDLSAYRDQRFREGRLALSGMVAALDDGWRVAPLVLAGKPYREILRLASEQQADLIVMGVQGRGAVERAFFGSTAQHVIRAAACPVLTLKAPD
jgi:nucleotide-binding universal stress UspA family protein